MLGTIISIASIIFAADSGDVNVIKEVKSYATIGDSTFIETRSERFLVDTSILNAVMTSSGPQLSVTDGDDDVFRTEYVDNKGVKQIVITSCKGKDVKRCFERHCKKVGLMQDAFPPQQKAVKAINMAPIFRMSLRQAA